MINRRALSPDIKTLSQLSPRKAYLVIAWDWALIILVASAAVYCGSVVASVFAILIIAGRQHALVGLMHEASHRRISTSVKINDWIGLYILSYPLFLDMLDYRSNHLPHHRYLNTEQDPDWFRKLDRPEWQFPMSARQFMKTLARYLYGYGFVELRTAHKAFSAGRTRSSRESVIRIAYYASAFALITKFGLCTDVAVYWLLPFAVLFPILQRTRSVAEHFGLPRTHELNQTRNVMASRLELLFLGPHNLNYHLDHHLFPTVPFYNLPALHDRLMQDDHYRLNAHQNTSYVLPSARSVVGDLEGVK